MMCPDEAGLSVCAGFGMGLPVSHARRMTDDDLKFRNQKTVCRP
jgi:hypothetical protein